MNNFELFHLWKIALINISKFYKKKKKKLEQKIILNLLLKIIVILRTMK